MFLLLSSCGGGGGGGGTPSPTSTGAIQGYVYIPYGSTSARNVSDTTGYKAYSGAAIKATCGSTVKNTTSGTNGYFKISSLPVVSCTVETKINGYITQTTQITVKANQTVTVGGADGVKMTPNTHGILTVTANVPGAGITLDGESTGISIPSELSYSFGYVSPGTHRVLVSKTGYDAAVEKQANVTAGNTTNVDFVLAPTGNSAPTANAGPDGKGFAGTKYRDDGWNGVKYVYTPQSIEYVLDGSLSSDPDGDALTYLWEQTNGNSVTLANANASKTTFIPVSSGTYTFKITVTDIYNKSNSDYVNIEINKIQGKLAFAGSEDQSGVDIFSMNADGTNRVRLTNNSYYDAIPRWSPDGTKIIYSTNPSDDETTYYPATMNGNGSNVNVLTTDTAGRDWSPDGQYILIQKKYNGYAELFRALPDGSGLTRITTTGREKASAYYSPNGTKITFVQNFGGDTYHIMVINSDGSNLLQLTNDSNMNLFVNWTPDGRILYTSLSCFGCNNILYVMNADGTGKQTWPVPSGVSDVENMSMTDDGKYIFYSDKNSFLHVMFADGSADMNLGLYGIFADYNPNP